MKSTTAHKPNNVMPFFYALKKSGLILSFLFLGSIYTKAQTTIFSENFETATGSEHQLGTTGYLGWKNYDITGTNNTWWIFDNSRSTIINGNHSMAISRNNPFTGNGTKPRYNQNSKAHHIAYYATKINATGYTNLTLDFKWICQGEGFYFFGLNLFDYGRVCWSTDGTTWTDFNNSGNYYNQNTTQTVTNLNISEVDGQQFYIGFRWKNDNSDGTDPSFIVDDIVIKGTQLTLCSTPNSPTNLTLTPTSNTINGTFTASTPAPNNYLVIISQSATAPTPTNGTLYTIGQTIGAYTVVDTDSNTVFTASGLNPFTAYYIYVFAFNNQGCYGGPIYSTPVLAGNTTTLMTTYCIPSTANNKSTLYINDVQFIGTLNDVSNNNNGYYQTNTTNCTTPNATATGYQDWTCKPKSKQAQGEGINVYVGSISGRGHYKAWVDWNKDNNFDNNPSNGELVYDSGSVATSTTTFGFVIPPNQDIGDYRIRIRFYNSFGYYDGPGFACDGTYEYYGEYSGHFNSCISFTNYILRMNPGCGSKNVQFYEYGEAEDYEFTVVQNCSAKIVAIQNGSSCGEGPVNLQVTGSASNLTYHWYTSEFGNTQTTTNADPLNPTKSNWSPTINTTTTYWVTADNGSCESKVRTKVTGTINPLSELTVTAPTTICSDDSIVEISATGDNETAYLIDEDFEGGGLGVFSVVNVFDNGTAQNNLTQWQNRSSTFIPTQQVWFPAISSGFGANHFAMATSDVNPNTGYVYTSLESPILDSSSFTNLTLNFDMYFSKYLSGYEPDNVLIYVSTDGGNNWTEIHNYDDDIGYGTKFSNLTLDLSAYVNQPNLKISIDYVAEWDDGVAIDNIKLFGQRPLTPSFTWTSATAIDAYTDANAITPYTQGNPISGPIYIKPTLIQLEEPNFIFTATATLANLCEISKEITIANDTKVWRGDLNTSQDWDIDNNWKPFGVPTADNCVIIPSTVKIPNPGIPTPPNPGYEAFAKNLTITNSGNLEILSSQNLTVTDWIHNKGTNNFIVQSEANLLQINSVANSGPSKVSRTLTMKKTDYAYWSSPVDGFSSSSISPQTSAGYIWKWLPTTYVNGTLDYGNWVSGNETMDLGKGYIVRGPDNFTSTPQSFTATFVGTPRNGDISVPITRGNYNSGNTIYQGRDITNEDDNYNLIGNPYPSAIDADKFLLDPQNSSILGSIYLWPHGGVYDILNLDPFYADYSYNYNSADYITYNAVGPNPPAFDGYIASGQSFFVLMTNDTPPKYVYFKNSMRIKNNNSQFLRSSNTTESSTLERHRIWLDLVLPTGKISTTLIGYIEGATYEKDRLFDSPAFDNSEQNLYSKIGNDHMSIQGRPVPFNQNDQVPLGILIPQQGIYTFAINSLDGLFDDTNQSIYLEDTTTGTIHNLRASPYIFNAEAGRYDNRFILRYTDEALSTDNPVMEANVSIFGTKNLVKVTSGQSPIHTVSVYDILGRKLVNKEDINALSFTLNTNLSDATYIVKVTLNNKQQKIKKVVLRQ
ncbi:MAG: T9SS sorting signal type C domain-containing protein [Gelidibacter sp.]